jgi:lactate racemase
MECNLLYGRSELTINLPPSISIREIVKHPMPILPDGDGPILQSFASPIGCKPLSELARGRKDACILICDITRPVPNGRLLPPLVDTLITAGIERERILILVATGLHRPNEGDELRELVGSDEIFSSIRIENHFARDRDAHVDLGVTSTGIPIGIDRRFIEADLRLITGLVEPHFMAGYSGGRKVVAPGVAYQDTILTFHTAHVLEHPRAVNCVMEGNPLHEAQIEIIRAIGEIYAINVAIDDKRRLGRVTFGEIEASHLEAVHFMRRYAEVDVDRKFGTIVTSAGGYPLDRTYYQTVKGMVSPLDILEEGGTIIIASECSEGMGSAEFVAAQQEFCRRGTDGFMDMLGSRSVALIDEWQTEMLIKPLRHGTVKLYTTGLSKLDLSRTGIEPVASLTEAILESTSRRGDSEIAVIPEGPYVVPRYRPPR